MANILDDLLDDAKKKGSQIWGTIKSSGKDKLTSSIQNLNDVLPEIEEAGFQLVRLDVDISLLPRLFARFREVKSISNEERKDILEKTKKNKFLHFMLLGLFKAIDVRKDVQIDNLDLREIELEIGLTPSAKLIFRRDDKINLIK